MIEKADSSSTNGARQGGPRGSVMVVGGGIAGMQSALDLADSGFKVYLVEKETAIGGRMAQLDKTFPTNDCAMCTISPRLIDVARHDNVEIITGAELTELSGKAGDFTASVHLQPRFVDLVKCNACGECLEVCPVALPAEFEDATADRPAIHRRYPQAIPGEFAISKQGVSPCRIDCPANCNAHAYIALIGQKRYDRAISIIRQALPLPGVMGRICDHACESSCHRAGIDQSLAICNLKRFAADWEAEHAPIGDHGMALLDEEGRQQVATVEKKPQRVAVVGSGPAGLTVARDLILEGYGVTIFEAEAKAGGMLRYGIPRYRLEAEVLDREIQSIVDLGVELKTGVRVSNPQDLLSGGDGAKPFDAAFVAIGAWTSRNLSVPGEDAEGVWDGLKFLYELNSGRPPSLGANVVVIGGGDVAMDGVCSARRLGSDRTILAYRRTRAEMPAHDDEIRQAEQEGVEFMFLLSPVKILTNSDGRVRGVLMQRMELGEPDESGRRRPVPIAGDQFELPADAVIVAIGQNINPGDLGKVSTGQGGRIEVDETTLATNIPGIFAGGDAVMGPSSAVKAIAQGHTASQSMIRHLQGLDLAEGRQKPAPEPAPEPDQPIKRRPRLVMPTIEMQDRLSSFAAIATGYSEEDALAEASRCMNCSLCCECMECVRVCSPDGIDHEMPARDEQFNVGSVILAAGYDTFDPGKAGLYLYGQAPNVVTNLQFERMCSSSGPTGGELARPSDGKRPKRIAWIQCVGSRDVTCDSDYCSGFCCMASIKEATMTRDHYSDCETTIFYNDIRAYGKGFERYYARAADVHGVQFVKSLPARLTERTQTGEIIVHYGLEDGTVQSGEFDLVVLATGMQITDSARKLAQVAGIEADRFGFCHGSSVAPNQTSRDGVLVAGVLAGPCDIPESVVGGSAAAALAMRQLSAARDSEVSPKQFPPERDVSADEPRVGVFVCRCGTNIARVVDVPSLAQYAATLPNVAHAEENLYTCSTDSQARIIELIQEKQLNRVVVSSCTPRTHEGLFRQTLREAGLNPYLFEMANIRDQCSWVHESAPAPANDKARSLLRMAVRRAAELEAIPERSAPVTCSGLVIGGGPAGMTAASNLSAQGFDMVLVERADQLGGQLKHVSTTFDGADTAGLLNDLISRVDGDPKITVLLNTEAVSSEGHIGQFTTVLRGADGHERTIEHGVVIFATGGQEYRGQEYGLSSHPRVCTQRDLAADLAGGADVGQTVVMIQCVGSRDQEHPYCSRVCCNQAVSNALAIKAAKPETDVYVLHRGMRTYGLAELEYRKAREAGVIFVRFDDDRPPQVDLSGDLPAVTVSDPAVDYTFNLAADRVVLSTGVTADPAAGELAKTFKVPIDEDGFLLEAHIKLRPVDFANEGMYVCGLAHAPKNLGESIAQALAASARAARVLSKDQLPLTGYTAVVDQDRCAVCMTCARICPYGVPKLDNDKRAMHIDEAICHGCGSCAAACPLRAIQVGHYKPSQVQAGLEGLKE